MRIRKSAVYKKWFQALRDYKARARIIIRLKRLAEGNLGDVKPVGDGIMEMRIFYGPGYRIYYKQMGRELIVLLCGGDKSTQEKDIMKAKEIAAIYKVNEE